MGVEGANAKANGKSVVLVTKLLEFVDTTLP